MSDREREEELPSAELDPFSRHRSFQRAVRGGQVPMSFDRFLRDRGRPIDTKVDKHFDLDAFGRPMKAFVKEPRPKQPHEYPEGLEDRMREDLERQFILRNLMRYVVDIDKDDPLEYRRTEVGGGLKATPEIQLRERYRPPELLNELTLDRVAEDQRWRHEIRDVIQWETYFCREIKEDFKGPLWKHHPIDNPVVDPDEEILK